MGQWVMDGVALSKALDPAIIARRPSQRTELFEEQTIERKYPIKE